MRRTSFTDLLYNNNNNNNNSNVNMDDEQVPKFKSLTPPSLPLSPSPISPSASSYLANFSPSEFLNSPFFLASPNMFASPTTTEAFAGFNWRNNSGGEEQQHHQQQQEKEEDETRYSDFSFQTQTTKPSSSLFQSSPDTFQVQEPLNKPDMWKFIEPGNQAGFQSERLMTEAAPKSEHHSSQSFPSEMEARNMEVRSNSGPEAISFDYANASVTVREQSRSEDGYHWRKYGQKQVKGSENPRSYYKCTHPNCAMKKKVERSLDGQITEIVYRGSHNHPKPQPTRRTSTQQVHQSSSSCTNSGISDQSVVTLGNAQMDRVSMQEDSSASMGEEELEQTSPTSYSGGDGDEVGPEAKRWKGENENEGYSGSGSRTVKEPRFVIQTTSEIDILDDGYRWRKYGQKVVKGNPNARSYYKCTAPGCSVRKHVERAAQDIKSVITTYEGRHNHDVPAARGSTAYNNSRNSLNTNNSIVPAPIRPSAVSGYSSTQTLANSLYNAKPQLTRDLERFPLDMLQDPVIFPYSLFARSTDSHNNPAQFSDAALSKPKDERKDDSFFQSFLSKDF